MRGSKSIVSGLALGLTLLGVAAAAPAAPPAKAPVAAAEADCQKTGAEVSVLIDRLRASPNLPAARATFQVGIMDCMEGDAAAANKHYEDAKKLLSNETPKGPETRVPTPG
jgi:hypothetical protein